MGLASTSNVELNELFTDIKLLYLAEFNCLVIYETGCMLHVPFYKDENIREIY